MTLERLRELCLSMPGATEQIQWGADLVFKVGGKMFCVVACTQTRADAPAYCRSSAMLTRFAELVERDGAPARAVSGPRKMGGSGPLRYAAGALTDAVNRGGLRARAGKAAQGHTAGHQAGVEILKFRIIPMSSCSGHGSDKGTARESARTSPGCARSRPAVASTVSSAGRIRRCRRAGHCRPPPVRDSTRNCGPCRWTGWAMLMPMALG